MAMNGSSCEREEAGREGNDEMGKRKTLRDTELIEDDFDNLSRAAVTTRIPKVWSANSRMPCVWRVFPRPPYA